MNKCESNSEKSLTIGGLYPNLDDDQLKEAEDNLLRYLEVVLRIYNRIGADPEAYARLKSLTASRLDSKIDE